MFGTIFNVVLPDNCRICEEPLANISRIPVCPTCLSLPKPLEAEFFCRSCQTPFVDAYPLDEQGLCASCRQGLVGFDASFSFGSYEGPLRELIHLFKYGKVETLAGPLGASLLRALPRDTRFDLILPMPMHWRKRWERGFNQAELLAQPIAKRLAMKLSDNLARQRYTKPQAGLTEAQRRDNLQDSFYVRRPAEVGGAHILLIDDVLTTGATLRAAAATLKSAGASRVTALTLARVDRRNSLPNLASFVQAWPQPAPVESGVH